LGRGQARRPHEPQRAADRPLPGTDRRSARAVESLSRGWIRHIGGQSVKRLLPPLALAALVSTLAACGGGGGSNNTTSTQASNIPNPLVWGVDTEHPPHRAH